MNNEMRLNLAMVAAVIIGMTSASNQANAAPISIVNPSFEVPNLITDGSSAVPGATWRKVGDGSNPLGIDQAGLAKRVGTGTFATILDPTPDTLDAEQALYFNGPAESVFQVLSATLQANTIYTLTVDAGARDDLAFQPCEIRLGTVSNPMVSADFGANLLTGTVVSNTTPVNGAGASDGWQTWITTFTTGPSPAGLGNPLRVEIVTTGGIQSYFDNVRLDLTDRMLPVPESGADVPAGNVALGWTNMTPTTGTDVWVDVWFGTNPAALTQVVTKGLNTTSTTVNAPGAGTYYWRVDSYLDGAPTGTPVQSTVFNFIVTDSDGDGFPDAYELANTTPPSTTALNRDDDLEPDGLTNWQEYQLGTNPTNPDTDGDTLNDGPETVGVGSRPPTDPLNWDTDGDGLYDDYESNTGTWVDLTNTGTNPTKTDTDADGLTDTVETNTGTYVSATNTGTNPLLSDTDADGAGDWYEITASFTSPFLGTEKPNIPYPLPDPDASSGATNKPVKVYIMSGQSNMVGFGRYLGPETGTLETIVKAGNKFPNLVDGAGAWNVRNDVRYRGVISAIGHDKLAAGFGANTNSFGPELAFGQVMGWYHDEPVLLIKSSIGNRSLLWDCLPPGSPSFNYNGNTYAGYGDSPNSWPIGGSPSPFVWYGGKQYDDYFLAEADMGARGWVAGLAYPNNCQVRRNGVTYISKSAHTSAASSEPGAGVNWATYWNVYEVFNVTNILDNWAAEYTGAGKPYPTGQDFEIAGYVWWQGYGDQNEPAATRYRESMGRFITQIRAYYENRYPTKTQANAPFVLATLATDGGWNNPNPLSAKVAQAQLDVAGDVPNAKTIEARSYWRDTGPKIEGFHYNHNAETYMLAGDALGRGMIELQGNIIPPPLTSSNIVDDQSGSSVLINTLVTYTVTFSEDMNAATVDASDFSNGAATAPAPITIGTITETSPGVFTVQVTPTATGNLQLQLNAGTALNNQAGNPIDTTFAVLDNDTIAVTAAVAGPLVVLLVPADNASGVAANTNLSLTFDKNVMKGSGDIVIKDSGGTPVHTIAVDDTTVSGATVTINPPSDLAPSSGYYVEIPGAAITDLSGNPFAGISGSSAWNFTITSSVPSTTPIIVNPSFEIPNLVTDTSSAVAGTSWRRVGNGSNPLGLDAAGLAKRVGTGTFATILDPTPDPLDAEQALYLNGPTESVFQVLTATLQANTTYTLTVDAGDRDGLTFQPCEIRLGTAANPLVSADFGLNLLTGTVVSNTTPVNGAGANDGWQTWVTTFTTGPSPAGLGNQLRVELVTTGGIQSYFDNVRLVATSATTGFAGWQSANGTTGAINEDHDNDGVSNGIEWFLGGNTETTGFTALPGISNTGGALSVTWTKDAGYSGNYGTDFRVETSATLTGPWTAEASPGNVTITGNEVKYTFPSPLGAKNFARLKVTGP